jgi:hypothetical protein
MKAQLCLGKAHRWVYSCPRLVLPLLFVLLLWPVTSATSMQEIAGQNAQTLYLPLVIKSLPPPDAPVLNNISNPDGDGNYSVSWGTVSGATSYLLEEDDNTGFASPTAIGPTAATTVSITGKAKGTYYYRVKATNAGGSSAWSATKSVQVSKEPSGPEPGHYTGTSSVSFDVTADGRVCNFEIEVPFQSGTCDLSAAVCDSIVDGKFGWVETDPWFNQFENSISGTFDTRTHARGEYSIYFCGNTLLFSPSVGTWEASK